MHQSKPVCCSVSTENGPIDAAMFPFLVIGVIMMFGKWPESFGFGRVVDSERDLGR